MVGQLHVQMEWENSPEERDRFDNKVRCLSDGLGSSLRGTNNRKAMDGGGESDAHKLFGAPGSKVALQTFTKGKTSITVLLRLDNMSAVAYINNLGGTVSPRLVALARDLWM